MMRYTTHGVCAQAIDFDIEDGKVSKVHFHGGCPGNTSAVAALAEGRSVDDLIKLLSGMQCGNRGTSCPAQLAEALSQAKAEARA